jgi:hypothetical protein
MSLLVKNDQRTLGIDTTSHEAPKDHEELSVHTLLSIFSYVAKATAHTQTAAPSAKATNPNADIYNFGGSQLEQDMLAMMLVIEKMKTAATNLENLLNTFSNNMAISNAENTKKEGDAALSDIQQQIQKQQQEEQAQKSMSIFSWIVAAVVALFSFATGNFAMGLMMIAMQVASSVKIDSSGDTILSEITKGLQKLGLSPTAAQYVFGAIVAIASFASGNPGEALEYLAKDLSTTGIDAVGEVLGKIMNFLLKVAPDLVNGALASGVLTQQLMNLASDMVPSDTPDAEWIKIAIAAILSILTALLAGGISKLSGIGGEVETSSKEAIDEAAEEAGKEPVSSKDLPGAAGASSSTLTTSTEAETGIDEVTASEKESKSAYEKMIKYLEDRGINTGKLKTFFVKSAETLQVLGSIGTGAAQIGKGSLEIEEGHIESKLAVVEGIQSFLQMMQGFYSTNTQNDDTQYNDNMQLLQQMTNKAMAAFQVFDAFAQV